MSTRLPADRSGSVSPYRNVRTAALIALGAWIACLAAYWLLPFSFPLEAHKGIIAALLTLTTIMIWPALRAKPAQLSSSVVRPIASHGTPVVVLIGLPAPLLLFLDMYVIRGLSIFGDIGANRILFIDSAPSIVGYLSYVSCAASLLATAALPALSRRLRTVVLMTFALAAGLLVMAGNRQFATAGILVCYLSYVLLGSGTVIRKLALGAVGAVAFSVVALAVQFARQSFAEGEQLEYLVAISKIECHGPICRTPAVIPAMYVYQYYGTVYIGASFYILQEISTPPLSTTLPILYRRVSGFFGLPSHQQAVSQALSKVESESGVFPNFWKTMYGHLYSDFGWIGIIAWVAIYRALITRTVRRFVRSPRIDRVAALSVILAFTIVGVMFTPTTEPIFAVALVMTFVGFMWYRVRFLGLSRGKSL